MPHDFGSDGYFRLEATRALARGELLDTPYSLVMSVIALPLYHFGDVLAQFNVFVLFAGLAALALILRRHAPIAILRRAALLVLTASMFGHHTQVFFGEVLTAVCVAAGLAWIATSRATLGYCVAAIGVVNAPATLPALFLMSAERARRLRRAWPAVWPAALCALGIMLEFYLRRGSPFDSGYGGDHGEKTIMPYSGLPEFSYPIVFGLLSILLSFGKGLAFFIPGLWLMLKRTASPPPDALRTFQRHAAWFTIGLVLVYAKWWAWAGGWFWGPRFFLFASIPASIALSLHLSDRRASIGAKILTLAVLVWSTWVGIDGAVYGQLDMAICNAQPDFESLCLYTPEYSALFRPFVVSKTLTMNQKLVFGHAVLAGVVLAAPLLGDLWRAGRQRATVWRQDLPQAG